MTFVDLSSWDDSPWDDDDLEPISTQDRAAAAEAYRLGVLAAEEREANPWWLGGYSDDVRAGKEDCARLYVHHSTYGDFSPGQREPELLDDYHARVRLRGTTVVYRCYDEQDVLLYVGQTQEPWSRGGWLPMDGGPSGSRSARITYEVFSSRRAALQAERDAIRTENPTENLQRYENTPVASAPIRWSEVRDMIIKRIKQQLTELDHHCSTDQPTDALLNELAASASQLGSLGQHNYAVALRAIWRGRDETERAAGALLDSGIETLRPLAAAARQHISDVRDALAAGTKRSAHAWNAALRAGWTADELRSLNLENDGRKPRARHPRATERS